MKKTLLSFLSILFITFTFAQTNNYIYVGYVSWASNPSQIDVIDTTGGAFTTVNSLSLTSNYGTGVTGVYGLSVDPTSGDMFILYQSTGESAPDRRLGTLDTTNGAITDIGFTGNMTDITFDNNGVLYATSGSYDSNYGLYTVDPNTGAATSVLNYVNGNYGPSLFYNKLTDTLVHMHRDDVIKIDPISLTETVVASTPGEIQAIEMMNDSMYYVVNYEDIYSYNVNTGAFNLLTPHSDYIHAFTFGKIGVIVFVNGPDTFCSNAFSPSFLTLSETGINYQWYLDGNPIAGEDNDTLVPTTSGVYTCEVDGRFSLPVSITVLDAPTASFSASPNPVDLGFDPTGTVNFTNASTFDDQVLWDFGNGFQSTALDPSFPFTSVGNYDVQLIAYNTNGCSDTTTQNIEVISSVGIAEAKDSDQFTLFPNPTVDIINISNEKGLEGYTATLIDLSGKIITYQSLETSTNSQMDLGELAPGTYLIKISNGTKDYVYKVSKK